jgi:hypothetical protein
MNEYQVIMLFIVLAAQVYLIYNLTKQIKIMSEQIKVLAKIMFGLAEYAYSYPDETKKQEKTP